MKKILSYYWLSHAQHVNLGDYLTVPVLQHFGYEMCDIRTIPDADLPRYPSCVSVIGTVLRRDFLELYARTPKTVVWGSGTDDHHGLRQEDVGRYDFRAVRGPRTRDLLALDPRIPLGDPALFLPEIIPARGPRRGVIVVPHYTNAPLVHARAEYAGLGLVNMMVDRSNWMHPVLQIATAEFALVNSLHGAIIAQAYGTPWAFCCAPGEAVIATFKWLDWFEYLGLDLRIVRSLREGMTWWDQRGQFGRLPSLQPLRMAFPHELGTE